MEKLFISGSGFGGQVDIPILQARRTQQNIIIQSSLHQIKQRNYESKRPQTIYKSISKGNETLELVGSNKEYFLNMMSGQGQKVDALITDAASFANNAKEQLFYEFVQNAYDASADSLFFYANEEFLIVLNNGEPFFTDLNIFDLPEGEEPRDGQLYNFLALISKTVCFM